MLQQERANAPLGWGQLNPDQKAAVLHDKGPAAVFAGPGSGKTRVVTIRAARLIEQGARVLVTTFTNDATEEMRKRIKAMIPRTSSGSADITTIHSFCYRALKQRNPDFNLLIDEGLRKGLAELSLAMELEGGVSAFLDRIGYLKNTGVNLQSYTPENTAEDRLFHRIWRTYEKHKAEKRYKEFDDLTLDILNLFQTDPQFLCSWAERYTHIMVDESQDMNFPQYAITLALGKFHHNVMLVGDPDQSLYGFRGADLATFRQFAAHPSAKVYELKENYRSSRSIISFANALIRQDTTRRPIVIRPVRETGVSVRWRVCGDADEEAIAVADQIKDLHSRGLEYRSMAVLFRVNAQAEPFERIFASEEIPFVTQQNGDFYSRKEIAGMLAYLEFLQRFEDEWLLSFLNVPNRKLPRSVGAEMKRIADIRNRTIWESLADFTGPDLRSHKAIQNMRRQLLRILDKIPGISNAGEAIEIIRHETGFDPWLKVHEVTTQDNDRIQNLDQMQDGAKHYKTIPDYLNAIRKVREEKERRKQEMKKRRMEMDAVTLSTGHAAKGLEWRAVFAVGWSEQILPHRRAEDVDEERRIAYVIATRAKDVLSISSLETWNGAITDYSRFLKDINLSELPEPSNDSIETDEDKNHTFFGGLFMT
jgi:DNA helicase-2/ATP-dependent DNA helicase PcrA